MKNVKAMLTILTLVLFVAAGYTFASTELAKKAPELSGKVIEAMESGGYTYVRIEKDGTKTWVAVPVTKIEKGTTVTFNPGTPMKKFTSKTLGRTFNIIYFSSGVAK